MITGFHHTGITVRDLDAMVAFYTQHNAAKLPTLLQAFSMMR